MLRITFPLLLFFLALFNLGHAEDKEPTILSLPSQTTHHGDFFAVAKNVEISGKVEGDLYVLGSDVYIDGHVTGDVLVCALHVEISGRVDNNVRVIAGQANISGSVGYNATIVAASAQVSSSSKIGGNLVIAAGSTQLAATVKGDANIAATYLRVSGSIDDRLFAYVGGMHITSRASIGKDLDYRSSEKALIDPGASIGGQILYHPSIFHRFLETKWIQRLLVGSKIMGILMNFVYSFVIGWILWRLFPRNVESALSALQDHPMKCLGSGLIVLILFPLVSFLLLISILGMPFALTLIALNVITFYTAKIFSVIWVTEKLSHGFKIHMGKYKTLAAGLILYFLLTAIPYVGFLVTIGALLFGLGAGVVGGSRRHWLEKLTRRKTT